MVRKKAKGGFLLNGSYNALLDSTKFIDVPGTQWLTPVSGQFRKPLFRGMFQPWSATLKMYSIWDVSQVALLQERVTAIFSDYNPLKVEAFITEIRFAGYSFMLWEFSSDCGPGRGILQMDSLYLPFGFDHCIPCCQTAEKPLPIRRMYQECLRQIDSTVISSRYRIRWKPDSMLIPPLAVLPED